MARLSKKVAKLEKKAGQLRSKAEKKGKQLVEQASDKAAELTGREQKRSRKGLVALLLAAGAAIAVVFKRKRDQELDEALWEEPKSI